MSTNIPIERKDGEVIMADHYKPDKGRFKEHAPLVIMVPGFPKNQSREVNFFGLVADIIKDIGLSSLLFDYTGSVTADAQAKKFSFKNAALDMETIFEWAENNGYKKLAFLAEGLGAPVVFMNFPDNAVFTILCWPVFDLLYVRDKQFNAEENNEELERNGFFNHEGILVGSDLLDELKNTDLTPCLQEAYTPTMILHGMKDTVIPIKHLDVARKDLMVPRLNITSFDDGEYGLSKANHRKTSIHCITEFIEKYQDFDPHDEN